MRFVPRATSCGSANSLVPTGSTFTTTLDIPEDAKAALMAMSPANYVGNAAAQAHAVTGHIKALRK